MANYDYTTYSFEQLHAEITQKLITQTEWADIGDSATSQTLIQLLAYTVDKLHYMLERRTQESYLPTAILPTSVKALASTVGYLPRRKVSAEGTLELTIIDVNGNPSSPIGNIIIPKYTTIILNDGRFLTTEEYAITPTDTTIQVNVIEGEYVTKEFLINDVNSDLYNHSFVEIIDFESIEENSLEVYTTTQKFNNVQLPISNQPPIESLEFADNTDLVYDVKITHNGMRILLGDGNNGVKPVGNKLFVSYIISKGDQVQVNELGQKFSFETDLLQDDINVIPANQYRYLLTNITKIDGGIAEESIEEIKRNAPNFARTGNRAVTKFDYQYWIRRSGIAGIVDASCYSEQEVGYNVFNMNNVYVSYLKNDGTFLTTAEKTELQNYMERYKSVTSYVVYHNPNIIPLQIELSAKKHPDIALSDSEFYDVLKQSLTDYFKFTDGKLGTSVYVSSLMKYLTSYTVIKNGVSRLVVDFVDIVAKALWKFTTPIVTQNQDITLTLGNVGDLYNFVINGHTYTYTQQASDTTANILAASIEGYLDGINTGTGTGDPLKPPSTALIVGQTYVIDDNTGADFTTVGASSNVVGTRFVATGTNAGGTGFAKVPIDAQANNNVVNIISTENGIPFSIHNTGSTQLNNIYIEQIINIPKSTVIINPTDTYLKAGSVEIIDTDGTVVAIDDGLGNIASGTIDYVTGEMKINTLSDNTYYVRYNHIRDNSFIASKRDVYTYHQPKNSFYDATELLSRIVLL